METEKWESEFFLIIMVYKKNSCNPLKHLADLIKLKLINFIFLLKNQVNLRLLDKLSNYPANLRLFYFYFLTLFLIIKTNHFINEIKK
jgi:hypothetical protein